MKTKTWTTVEISAWISSIIQQYPGITADQILALFQPDSKNWHRAWGCLAARGLINDPELEEILEGFAQ